MQNKQRGSLGPRIQDLGPAVQVAPGGFEPPFSDPKSDVLPLDEGAASPKSYWDVSTCTTRSLVRVTKTAQPVSRASAAASGASENTPKTAEPEPASIEINAPRAVRSSIVSTKTECRPPRTAWKSFVAIA